VNAIITENPGNTFAAPRRAQFRADIEREFHFRERLL
jgi:hypothetical protein